MFHDAFEAHEGAGDHSAPLTLLNEVVRRQWDACAQGLIYLREFGDQRLLIRDINDAGHPVGLEHLQTAILFAAEKDISGKQRKE